MMKMNRVRYSLIVLGIAAIVWSGLPVQAQQQGPGNFVAAEVNGAKVWQGGGAIDLKGSNTKSLTLMVVNPLAAEHGFSIDTMKVKEVIKPGEEKIITVPIGDIDPTITEHRVYCQLHPKHGAATLTVTGR
jgi:hypothetical protein